MRRGADWYPRVPNDYLGGVQGLSVRQHAVYSVVLDLLYTRGGEIPNDPKFIAGYFSDLGVSAVRNTISDLVESGKLIENAGKITQKRAKNEAKTREELSENGKKLAEKRWKKQAQSEEKQWVSDAERIDKSDAYKNRIDNNIKKTTSSDVVDAYEAFTMMASNLGMPIPKSLTNVRRKAINARLTEHGPEGIQSAFDAIKNSKFLMGREGSERWRRAKGASIDWVFNPTNFAKIIEGKYNNERSGDSQNRNSRASGGGNRTGSVFDGLFDDCESAISDGL